MSRVSTNFPSLRAVALWLCMCLSENALCGDNEAVVGEIAPSVRAVAGRLEGFCVLSDKRRISIADVPMFENRSLIVGGANKWKRLTIDGEVVSIATRESKRTEVHQIDRLIEGTGKDVDLELRFALHENRVVIYWRETFQHRAYRQGLLEIVDGGLRSLCEGKGGADSNH